MNARLNQPLQDRVRLVYYVFLAAAVASFVYCVLLNQYNGDFYPQPVYLPVSRLLVIFAISVLPLFIAWKITGLFERLPARRVYVLPTRMLWILLVVGFGSHIAATFFYGVGVMDQEVYEAPALLQPIIQVINRLDPFYIGVFFILSTPKRALTDLIAISLMISLGFLRAGLGSFNYVLIALFIKYSLEIIRLFKQKPWVIITAAATLPTLMSSLYSFRAYLRGDIEIETGVWDVLFGRLAGRLSSFSNAAYIDQNSVVFVWLSNMLEPLYYLKQGLVTILGSGVAPEWTPEKILISGTQDYGGYSTYMTGVPGNLFFAWNVSPLWAALNAFSTFATVVLIIWLSRFLGNGIARAFGIGMLFYPLVSGVANEFSQLLLNTIFLVGFSIFFGRTELRRGPLNVR